MSDDTNPYAAIEATAAKPDADKGANPYADIEAKAKPAPIVGTTDSGGQLPDDPEAAAARGVPGMTPEHAVYDPKQAAPASAIARASLAAEPELEKQRYSQFYKQPIEDFSVHGDKVIRKTADNRYVYAEPPDWSARLESPQKYAASGVGQAIPMATGALAGWGAGALAAPTTPLGMGVAATAAHAAGGAGGEIIRQSMDRALAPDATPMDWANVGWQALQQGLGPLGGKAADVAGKGLVGAGKWTASQASALAGKLGDMIQDVPGLQGLVAQGKPIVQNVTQAVDDAGQNLLGLTQEARDAVMHHLAGKFDDIKAGIQNARDNWGIDLSIGQATEDPEIMRRERQLARSPWGNEAFNARKKLQNDEQVPGAVGKLMDDISPWKPDEQGQAVDAFREGAVASRQQASTELNAKARQAFGTALDAKDAAGQRFFSPDVDELFQRPSMQRSLSYARDLAREKGYDPLTIPEYENGKQVGDAIVPTWRGYEYIRKAMSDQIRAPENTNQLTGKLNAKGQAIQDTYDEFMGTMLKKNPEWADALTQYGTDAHDMNLVLRGGLKKLADMDQPDRLAMVTNLFGGGKTNPLPNDIGEIRQYFVNANKLPEWNAGIRSYVQSALDDAMKTTQGAERSNVGGKLYSGLFDQKGKPGQRAVIQAAVNDPQIMARWDSLGDALRRAAHQLPENSATSTDISAATGLKGMVGKMINVGKAATNIPHAAVSALEDYAAKGETPEMRRQIVNYMLTTDGDAQLRALQSTMNTSALPKGQKQFLLPPPAQKALGAFLAAAAAHTDTVQGTPQEPTYRHGGTIDRAHAALRNLPRLAS